MCNHFSSLAPYSTPVASNAQIHSNPSTFSTIFSRHMSTSFDQKESTYLFALDINMHLEFKFQKKHSHSKYQKKSEPLFIRTSSSNCIVWLQYSLSIPLHFKRKGHELFYFVTYVCAECDDSRYEKRWASIGRPISCSALGYKKTRTRTNTTK